jgi:hypothetical protein
VKLDIEFRHAGSGLDLTDEVERSTVPTGWVHTGLGAFQVHIMDGSRTHHFDRNTLRTAVTADTLRFGSPLGPSDISRQPAYLYRTSELQILLTTGEIHRLVLHHLQPSEVQKLRKRYGNFFEIDEDFYHRDTGEAL